MSGLTITRWEGKGVGWIADRPLYLNADKTKALEEGDPDCAFVLCGKGSTVPEEDVVRYGLKDLEPEGEILPDPLVEEVEAVESEPIEPISEVPLKKRRSRKKKNES